MRNGARVLTLAMSVLAPDLAQAQDRAHDVDLPRLEVGGIASFVTAAGGGGGVVLLGGGPTVTIGLARRIRLDLRAEVLGPQEESGVYGLYETQVRIPLRQSPDGSSQLSMSAGVAGGFFYHSAGEYRTTRPDGSVVVYPGYRELDATAPTLPVIGIIHQRVVGRRASAIFAADVMVGMGAIAVRATAGVSFGARRYR